MDLTSVLLRRPHLVTKVEAQGFDLDTLFALCEELFALTDDLGMAPVEVGEFVLKIKNVASAMRALPVVSHTLFEKTEAEPVRLSIENSNTKQVQFFKLLPGTSGSSGALFKCEDCGAEVLRTEAKEHVLRIHDA
jgi:hypothetical protein